MTYFNFSPSQSQILLSFLFQMQDIEIAFSEYKNTSQTRKTSQTHWWYQFFVVFFFFCLNSTLCLLLPALELLKGLEENTLSRWLVHFTCMTARHREAFCAVPTLLTDFPSPVAPEVLSLDQQHEHHPRPCHIFLGTCFPRPNGARNFQEEALQWVVQWTRNPGGSDASASTRNTDLVNPLFRY